MSPESMILSVVAAIFVAVSVSAQAAVNVTPVSSAEFSTVFDFGNSRTLAGSDAVWYVQAQATGNPTFNLELGGTGPATDFGSAGWTDGINNPFSVSVDGAGNLNFIFNGQGTGDGLPTVAPFNEVYVGIRLGANFVTDVLSLNKAQTDGPALFPDLSVTGAKGGSTKFSGYKFHFDDKLSNIGEFIFQGDLNPDMVTFASGEQWTMTVVGVYNPEIVPEPSSFLLLFATALSVFARRRRY